MPSKHFAPNSSSKTGQGRGDIAAVMVMAVMVMVVMVMAATDTAVTNTEAMDTADSRMGGFMAEAYLVLGAAFRFLSLSLFLTRNIRRILHTRYTVLLPPSLQ